ncbi:LytR C-terminal domain-containing protein [Demequina aurantiaca]|uniref:LytR C-terminal domain-containing protein n=1 Tax=Demequina aurantiaca TaxID=676200 RepID=UPI003D346A66
MPDIYEPDEFDEIARSGGPVGVHRAPRKWYVRLLPPLLVFIAAGLFAYVIATFLWNQDSTTDAAATPSPTASISATPSATPSVAPSVTPSPTPSPTPTPTETAEPEPEIIYDAQVHVRNGSGVAGLAAEQQADLEAAGYTNIEANNISSSLIPDGQNTVTYSEDRLADTAANVAQTLGIEAVQGGSTPGGAEIEVLLASNPDA